MKSVVLDPRELSPLPREKWGSTCCLCKQDVSKWEWADRGNVCASCFLYESPWGKKRRDDLRALLAEIEKAEKNTHLRTEDDRLLLLSDADVFLGKVAVTSKMLAMVNKLKASRG